MPENTPEQPKPKIEYKPSILIAVVVSLLLIVATVSVYYLNSNNKVGQFCGGIAGVQCPAGFSCQMDGNYPDAGGKCVRSIFSLFSKPQLKPHLQTNTPFPTPTDKVHIDSMDNPELGLAGYSSGTIKINGKDVQLTLYSNDRKKVINNAFPCETRPVTVAQGTYKIAAENSINGQILDTLVLGKKEFVMEPVDIQQYGRFTKTIILQDKPLYEAFTLPFKDSCYDNKAYFFTFNEMTKKVEKVKFLRKDGTVADFIYIPKAYAIPQIDHDNNIISSRYDEETGFIQNVRYKFNPTTFRYEELESYSQRKK